VSASTPPISIRALDAFVEVLAEADAGVGADAFYGRLCEVICRLAGMDRAVLFRYDAHARRTSAAGAHGLDLALFAGAHVTVETAPIARAALMTDQVVETSVAQAEVPPRYASLLHHGRLFCVPLAANGRWIGVVLCDRSEDTPLEPEERDLLWTLGKTAALAASARIATAQGERARLLQQRIDLARELHDGVVQRLFGTALALEGEGPLAAAERRRAATEVQGALADLRMLIGQPLAREPRPTTTTLAEVLAGLQESRPGLPLRVPVAPVVPAHLEALAQSVLAEAVRNVTKHADPTEVAISARLEDGAFVLEIVNDGVRPRQSHGGLGLRLAAFEALQHGGFVEFGERQPGRWLVRLAVPVGGPADG
jgi:signal transduction histidine kinase